MSLTALHHSLLQECRRRLFEESFQRLRQCLNRLSEEDIWYRPNAHSNSVGNLTLHLCGNVRQWVVGGLGGWPDTRQRQAEFDEQGPLPTERLLELLDETEADARAIIDQLQPEDWTRTYHVQGFEETGVGIMLHVVEHFSYHVGQVTYFLKVRKNASAGYYEGMDLDAKG